MNPLLERGNTRLDTVEPDWYGNANSLSEKHTALVAKWKGHGTLGLYSRETVESLLSQCRQDVRKEALLEAAAAMVRLRRGFNFGLKDQALCEAESELRRMAEREKG